MIGYTPWSIGQRIHTARTLFDAGIVTPTRPDKLVRIGLALRRFGPTPAAGYTGAAIRYPDEPALVDELGTLTFGEIHRRTNALAHSLSDAGVVEGDGVAIMCRNHRGFVDATVACSKLGAHALYLNTAFAGSADHGRGQARGRRARSSSTRSSRDLVEDAAVRRKRFIAWHEPDDRPGRPDARGAHRAGRPGRRRAARRARAAS